MSELEFILSEVFSCLEAAFFLNSSDVIRNILG